MEDIEIDILKHMKKCFKVLFTMSDDNQLSDSLGLKHTQKRETIDQRYFKTTVHNIKDRSLVIDENNVVFDKNLNYTIVGFKNVKGEIEWIN